MPELVVHIAHEDDWRGARLAGSYVPPGFAEDGFVHMSRPEQAHIPANALFSGRRGLVLLWIDVDRLTAELRYEVSEAEPGEAFPHLYGPLPVDAVVAVTPLEPWQPGAFALPPPPGQAAPAES